MEEAQRALQSKEPVLKNRHIEVVACSGTTATATTTAAATGVNGGSDGNGHMTNLHHSRPSQGEMPPFLAASLSSSTNNSLTAGTADITLRNSHSTGLDYALSGSGISSSPSSAMAGAAGLPPTASTGNDEVSRGLELIQQRRRINLQGLQNNRSMVEKTINLVGKFADYWKSGDETSRQTIETRMHQLVETIFSCSREIFRLVRMGIEREEPKGEGEETPASSTEGGNGVEQSSAMDNTDRANKEVEEIMDRLNQALCDTSLAAEVSQKALMLCTELMDECSKQASMMYSSMSGGFRGARRGGGGFRGGRGSGGYRGGFRGGFRGGRAGKSYRTRVDTSKYELDFRPNVVILKDLEGASESEIREGLKEFTGVRGVTVENGEASVIFEKHWQTSRPIKEGVTVNGRVRRSNRFNNSNICGV